LGFAEATLRGYGSLPGEPDGAQLCDMNPRHALARAGTHALAAYDASPLATHALAERARDGHLRRAEEAAMADPEYAAIDARRHDSDRPGSSIFLSKEHNLGWDEYRTQSATRRRLTPTPAWWALASFVAGRPVRTLAGRVRARSQRGRRGWADRDTWGLDGYLCTTLAGALNHMAETSHGWPGGTAYPEFEDWTAALRKAATALSGWANHDDSPAANAADDAFERGDAEFTAATAAHTVEDTTRLVAAQDALHWVADNLPNLWD